MAERPITVPDASGNDAEGREVNLIESTERFSELRLEDGSTLKIKPNVLQIVRLVEKWDSDDNPIYVVKSQSLVVVADAPADLKRRKSQ